MIDLRSSLPKCTYCGRPAIYRRKTSGEYFCEKCFIPGFLRRLHRTIAKYSMLSPYSKITLILLPDIPYTSLALIDSVMRLEERYPSEIYIIIPADAKWSNIVLEYIVELTKSRKTDTKVYSINYAKYYEKTSSLFERYCLSRLLALVLAKKNSSRNVLLPYNLDTLAVLFIASTLSSKVYLGVDLVPVKTIDEVAIGYPLYDMVWEDIVFYNYLTGATKLELEYDSYSKCNTYEGLALEMYQTLALDSSELAYNILKNPRILGPLVGTSNCNWCPCPRDLEDKCDMYEGLKEFYDELKEAKLETLYP